DVDEAAVGREHGVFGVLALDLDPEDNRIGLGVDESDAVGELDRDRNQPAVGGDVHPLGGFAEVDPPDHAAAGEIDHQEAVVGLIGDVGELAHGVDRGAARLAPGPDLAHHLVLVGIDERDRAGILVAHQRESAVCRRREQGREQERPRECFPSHAVNIRRMGEAKRKVLAGILGAAPLWAAAQEDVVVITATRAPRPSLEIPASVDRLYADEIRDGRAQVNLSESMGRVPGIVVQNRQNYAQDLQISSRGFGARAAFGVRGIRLIADGVPATMPDGQGQAATFALGSAESIEVLRGPFLVLYGNAAGGVILVKTMDGPEVPTVEFDQLFGTYGVNRSALKFGGQFGAVNGIGDYSHFETDGYRD